MQTNPIYSFYQDCVTPHRILVELHTRFQIPSFQILGLPAPEIQEARERIMAAFLASDFEFPKKKVIVNLAPSAIRKSGTGHDLSIALRILLSTLEMNCRLPIYAWGELGLDGSIKASGKIAFLIELLLQETRESLLVLSPEDSLRYRELLNWRKIQSLPHPQKIKLISVETLKETLALFKSGKFKIEEEPIIKVKRSLPLPLLPLDPQLHRFIEIATTGRHHALILGPKGVGKSHALHWFKALLPACSPERSWSYLLNQETRSESLFFSENSFHTGNFSPVREVHSQIKPAHLLGSWNHKGFRAGEIALAHGGLFIADEFLEWPRDSKECLREPLQNKAFTLTRALGQVRFQCDIQLVGTGNLCPCGGFPARFLTSVSLPKKKIQPCRCRPLEVQNYLQKLSGPIADRIDLISVHAQNGKIEKTPIAIEPFQKKIERSRNFARKIFGEEPSELSIEWLEKNNPAHSAFEKLLERVPNLRSRHKVMRIARSIQALELETELKELHVFEAISYRFMDSILH